MEREIELVAAGKEISLNRFVKDILVSVIDALLRTLDGFDANDEVVITLKKK